MVFDRFGLLILFAVAEGGHFPMSFEKLVKVLEPLKGSDPFVKL